MRTEIPLGQVETLLDGLPDDLVVQHGFHEAHSWRGIYDEVAFEPDRNVTVGVMRREVRKALTKTFRGYKGGDFTYSRSTPAHLSMWGSSNEYDWDKVIASLTISRLTDTRSGDEFGDEFVLHLENGNTIRTDTYADNPEGASYVRVCGPDGQEIAYWSSDEWQDDPQLVMGAILGSAGSAPDGEEDQ